MRINYNGIYREATAEETDELEAMQEQTQQADPLTEMAAAMSTAATLAQMRAAAKAFLDASAEVKQA